MKKKTLREREKRSRWVNVVLYIHDNVKKKGAQQKAVSVGRGGGVGGYYSPSQEPPGRCSPGLRHIWQAVHQSAHQCVHRREECARAIPHGWMDVELLLAVHRTTPPRGARR